MALEIVARVESQSANVPEENETERVVRLAQGTLKHEHNTDEALKAFDNQEEENIEIDEVTNARLVRVIDRNLMPLCKSIRAYTACLPFSVVVEVKLTPDNIAVCAIYFLNFLDKSAMSYASIMGFISDVELTGREYNVCPPMSSNPVSANQAKHNIQWLSSMFYFGYLGW